jgi:phosphatidylglycerol:prolipoprotein diacylglycerol transferase
VSELAHSWQWVLSSVPHASSYLLAWLGGAVMLLVGASVLARRDGVSPGRVALLLMVLTLATVVGARAHALFFESGVSVAEVLATPSRLLEPGWRLPGGLLLSMGLSVPLCALLRLPWRIVADAVLPFVGLLFVIGRLGCLARGCCMGHLTDLPWGLHFGPGTEVYAHQMSAGLLALDAPASLAVHPLPLFLGLGGGLISLFLLWFRPRRRFSGEVGLLGVAMLGLLMVGGELVRNTEWTRAVGLRLEIPLVLAVLAIFSWVVIVRRLRRRAQTESWNPRPWESVPYSHG